MPHTNRDNYKAKWLRALAEKGVDEKEVQKAVNSRLTTSITTTVTANLEIHKTLELTRDAASAAQELVETLDLYSRVGPLTAGKLADNVDAKLTKLPIDVMLRRIRDIIRIASERVAMFGESQDVMEKSLDAIKEESRKVASNNTQLQNQLVEAFMIGHDPESSERRDLFACANNSNKYHRYGMVYADSTYDTFGVDLLKAQGNREESDSDESDDDEPIEPKTPQPKRAPIKPPKSFVDGL